MIKCIVCCDVCGQLVPTHTEESPLGPIEVLETGKTKIWDIGNHFVLCKRCALLIDSELELLKLKALNGVSSD